MPKHNIRGVNSMESNKIILIIGALVFGGAERVICNLANSFAYQGNEVILISIHNKGQAYDIDESVILINGLKGDNIISKLFSLRSIIKNEQPKVVLSFLTHINIFILISTIGLNCRVVISERNDPNREPKQFTRKILRKIIYPLADGVVFQTNQAQEYFSKRIQNKSVIIPNPIFIDDIYPVSKKEKRIVNVGRLVPQKRQDLLIKAFKRIHYKYPEYILEIYGDGPERNKLEELILDLGLHNNVILHGTVWNLHSKIKDAEIFVLTSDYEGMPNALMEAIALGIPSISTDCPIGGPSKIIKQKENGLLIPTSNIDEIVYAIELLITNQDLREKLSVNGLELRKEFSFEKISNKWRDFLIKDE